MEQVGVRAERLEVEGSREVERVQEHRRVVQRQGAPGRRVRVLVEQRDGLALLEPPRPQHAVDEICHHGEIRDADRAEESHVGQAVVVERVPHEQSGLRTRGRQPAGECVGEAKRGRAHDVVRRVGPLGDPVLAHELAVVVGCLDAEQLPHPDTRRDAVRRLSGSDHRLDHGACLAHRRHGRGRELDRLAVARHAQQLVAGEIAACQHHRHGSIIAHPAGDRGRTAVDTIRSMSATHEQAWTEHASAGLRAAGHRSGGARRTVVDYLGRQSCCLSAQEIFDGVRSDGGSVGIASVYRVLDLLDELRLVQRVDIGDGVARFEAAQPGGDHHHHLVCDDCGRVEPFADAALERALVQVADRLGYEIEGHDVVLRGACGTCRPTP